MISNEKMEGFWMRHKSEAVPKGTSMQAFCSMHNVPYNAFEKYLKMRRYFSTAHKNRITGVPGSDESEPTDAPVATNEAHDATTDKADRLRIMVDIRMTNGINIRQKNPDYKGLLGLNKTHCVTSPGQTSNPHDGNAWT